MTIKQNNTEEQTALLAYSPRCLSLNILSELPDNIARGIVFTDVILRRGRREDRPSAAGCDCAAELSGRLPDNLGEVRERGVVGVIRAGFIRPQLDGGLNRKVPGASRKVLTKLAMRVLKFASVCPRLGRVRQLVTPSEGLGSMLGAEIIVDLEISSDIGIRYRAT